MTNLILAILQVSVLPDLQVVGGPVVAEEAAELGRAAVVLAVGADGDADVVVGAVRTDLHSDLLQLRLEAELLTVTAQEGATIYN